MKNLYFDGRIVSRLFLLITFLCFMFSVFGSVFFVGNLIASDRDFNVQFKKLDSGEWAFVSETGQMYKPKCLKTACVNRKTDYGCRNGYAERVDIGRDHLSKLRYCENIGNYVKCHYTIEREWGSVCGNSHTSDYSADLNAANGCYNRQGSFWGNVWHGLIVKCEEKGSIIMRAEKYIYNDTCLQTDCVEWEVDEIEILKMMPFVGTATVDPNFIEY